MIRRIIIPVMLIVLFAGGAALAQDDAFLRANDRVKPIDVPMYKEPPSFFYVPNEMIVQLEMAEQVRSLTVNRDQSTGLMVTGHSELDELNRKFGVTKFQREFPDMPLEVRAANDPNLSSYYVMEFSRKYPLGEVMKAYQGCAVVCGAEPIGVHPIYATPNDPYFASDQWNFYDPEDNDVDATDAWDLETGDEGVLLADLDSGLQYDARDLGGLAPYTDGNVWINEPEYNGAPGVDDDGNGYVDDWIGWDFVDNIFGAWPGEDDDTPDNEPTDFNGHGTHVGGIMGAITNNGIAVAGLAGGWNASQNAPANGCKVMALRIGWSAPHPQNPSVEVGYVRMDFAAQALYYATNKGATAVNCSWGSSNSGGLGAAVTNAINNGVIIVHAAGNSNSSTPDYLGSRTDVINVAATDDSDVRAYFSNYGTWVDIAAPGVDILSTYSLHYDGGYVAWLDGTSQACPHVTAAAGILKSYVPSLTASEITDLILNHTDNIDDINPSYAGLLGSGRLNVHRSLDAAVPPDVTVIQPNGGEVLYIGQEYDVTWDATDNVGIDSSIVDYSVDSGINWTRIASLTGNPGVYTWTVTGPPSDQCRMRVTCYDGEGMAGDDMSDEDFCPPYKRSVSGQLDVVNSGAIPETYALLQNHPNPFNASTQIPYALSEPGKVQLDVYNLLGQRVATLVDQHQEAGYHVANWDAHDAASGVYLYRIRTDSYTSTRKMVVLK
ncbi:MAG: S8 family serine peptidase [candidate division Zixibacteria bacterium]|nr:S8 family serine peptidase [candidate division Zixibacteria bacterium]